MQAIKDTKLNHKYIRNVLQKLIVAVESTSEVVEEGLYEKFAYYLATNLVTGASSLNSIPRLICQANSLF